jgi:osmotically-inducible protein OsmY
MKMQRTGAVMLMALLALGGVACSSTSETSGGDAERTGAKAGRVIDDSVITGKVKAALIADPTTKAHQIEVETFKGTVQLSGWVDSDTARTRASEVARNVAGVRDVKNSLGLRNRS